MDIYVIMKLGGQLHGLAFANLQLAEEYIKKYEGLNLKYKKVLLNISV